ncbi:hypothetical protein CN918_29665 [Priestia megaterium]|nr:hypothetical protein CN918_29665 [Priestia megaterium]
MREFEIWCEGFHTSDGKSGAFFQGYSHGVDLKDACMNLAKIDYPFATNFDEDRMTWWGCRIFDNECDARKSFG